MTGTDLRLLAKEMEKAKEVLKQIQEMKGGVVGNKKVKIQPEVRCLNLAAWFKNIARKLSLFNTKV